MMSKKAIKIICIVLAALMALSVFAVVFQILGLDERALSAAIPATGESNLPYLIPAIVIGAAVLAILCAVLIPKLRKSKTPTEEAAEPAEAPADEPAKAAADEPTEAPAAATAANGGEETEA